VECLVVMMVPSEVTKVPIVVKGPRVVGTRLIEALIGAVVERLVVMMVPS